MSAEVTLRKQHLMTIRANGLPKGQPRPRAFSRGGKAGVYDPGTAEGWKGAVASAAKEHSGKCIYQPLEVILTFFMPRPKCHYGTGKMAATLKPSSPRLIYDKKPDADNLAKAVLDALTEIRVWLDDDQVCDLLILKRWEEPGVFQPGCSIRISALMEVEL